MKHVLSLSILMMANMVGTNGTFQLFLIQWGRQPFQQGNQSAQPVLQSDLGRVLSRPFHLPQGGHLLFGQLFFLVFPRRAHLHEQGPRELDTTGTCARPQVAAPA